MNLERLRRFFAIALFIAAHLALAAILAVSVQELIGEYVRLGRFPVLLSCLVVTAGIVCILSAVRLATDSSGYRGALASVLERTGILPELLLISILFLAAFLLFVGRALTPLMGRHLFKWGLSILLLSAGIGLPMLLSRVRWIRFRGRMMSFLFGLLVSMLIAEAALRIIVKGSIYHPALDLRPNIHLEIRNSSPGVSPICIHSTNSLGLRGEEPPPDSEGYFNIITVGGSTTVCFYMDDRTTWPWLLQQELRTRNRKVWVGNGGLDGHSTRGHILFMTEVVPRLNPDMIIILCGVNDLNASIHTDGSPAERGTPLDCIYTSSRLLQILTRWKMILFENAEVTSIDFPIHFSPQPIDPMDDPSMNSMPTYLPALERYSSNLRTLIRLGREAGVGMVFLTQPTLVEDTHYWRGLSYPGSGDSYAVVLGLELERFNSELMRICAEEKVPCFDLAAAMANDPDYYVDDVHFSEAGTREVSRLVADYLFNTGLVPVSDE